MKYDQLVESHKSLQGRINLTDRSYKKLQDDYKVLQSHYEICKQDYYNSMKERNTLRARVSELESHAESKRHGDCLAVASK